jgi:hypothetical protein
VRRARGLGQLLHGRRICRSVNITQQRHTWILKPRVTEIRVIRNVARVSPLTVTEGTKCVCGRSAEHAPHLSPRWPPRSPVGWCSHHQEDFLSASASVSLRRLAAAALAASALVSVAALPASAADHAGPYQSCSDHRCAVRLPGPRRPLQPLAEPGVGGGHQHHPADGQPWRVDAVGRGRPHLHLRRLPPGRPRERPHPHR